MYSVHVHVHYTCIVYMYNVHVQCMCLCVQYVEWLASWLIIKSTLQVMTS